MSQLVHAEVSGGNVAFSIPAFKNPYGFSTSVYRFEACAAHQIEILKIPSILFIMVKCSL